MSNGYSKISLVKDPLMGKMGIKPEHKIYVITVCVFLFTNPKNIALSTGSKTIKI